MAGPRFGFFTAAKLRQWVAEEVAAAHLLPWLAVGYGFGIVLYFTADHEPVWWAGTVLAGVSAGFAVMLRRHLPGFVIALVVFSIAAGFAVATVKTALIGHPILRYSASGRDGRRLCRTERGEPAHRSLPSARRSHGRWPHGGKAGTRAAVGQAWYGAAGRVLRRGQSGSIGRCSRSNLVPTISRATSISKASAPLASSAARSRSSHAAAVAGRLRARRCSGAATARCHRRPHSRRATRRRRRHHRDADQRDAIDQHLYDAMFVSGIGHVLSISGYHMAVVAGAMFFLIRAFLALIPGLADRAPIKKWAALAALGMTAFYLLLSGNQVATQRSFIMIAVVLVGGLFDRPSVTMRTLTVAALVVHRTPEGFAIQSVRAADFDRPWSPASPLRRAGKPADEPSAAASASARTPPRDATPQPEDIEADQ
jgi:competence protein ComEC